MHKSIDQQMHVHFIVVLTDTITHEIAVMVESVYAFGASSAMVVTRGFGFVADLALRDCSGFGVALDF
jgi:hypothetical protein